jgi:hypothetical protein
MAEWTTEQLEEMAKGVLGLFDDGFQFSDIFQIVPKIMEVVALVKDTTGEEKKHLAIMLGEHVIDKTDFPWIPDAIVDPICKRLLPGAIQMAWDASKGKFAFGGNDATE